MKGSRGFSLVELLVVIVILGVLSAVAVPNIVAARRAANEASAIASLKTFLVANYSYFSVAKSFGTPDMLATGKFINDSFGTQVNIPVTLIRASGPADSISTVYIKSGYVFAMVPTRLEVIANCDVCPDPVILEYYMAAFPETLITGGTYQTGVRRFYIDSISNQPWVMLPRHTDPVCYPTYQGCIPVSK